MSKDSAKRGKKLPADLTGFLDSAYNPATLHELLSGRLASGVIISGVFPQRAHLTKDGRLIVAYRVQLFHPRYGLHEIPVFLQNATQSKLHISKSYRTTEIEKTFDEERFIRRLYTKAGPAIFVTAFPLDPQLRTPLRLLKPAELLACYNSDLIAPGSEPATSVDMHLLGYRAERRAIFKVRACNLKTERTVVVKIYRRQEAERVWKMCSALASNIESVPGVTVPLSRSKEFGALCYPFRDGETLHHLLEQGWAENSDLHRAGKLLRKFHSALPGNFAAQPLLRTFTYEQEWEILNRWRRFLKQGGNSNAGTIAKYVKLLRPERVKAPAPDALVHRDFYPKQLLLHPWNRDQALVDLDTMAHGPAALDVGNFLAHLHLHSVPHSTLRKWRKAFLFGYGGVSATDVALFELSSLVRMSCLALVGPPVPGLTEHLLRKARKLERSLR